VDLTTGYDPLLPYEELLEELAHGSAKRAGRHAETSGRHAERAGSRVKPSGEPAEPAEGLAEADDARPTRVSRVTFPVPDLSIPLSREQTRAILDTIDREIEAGGTVYLHCWGGVGRTGTIVGCWLVRHGMNPEEALARVAELWSTRPGSEWSSSPQTAEQFDYVREWREV
jgi:protein-tyrosine phosphatase